MASGKKIRGLLASKGMTQRQLANDIGIGESYMNKVVNGNINIRENLLWKICDALGCSPADIRGLDAEEPGE